MLADDLLARLRPALSDAAYALLEIVVRVADVTAEPGAIVCTFDPRDDEGDDDAERSLAMRQLRILDAGEPAPDEAPAPLRALFAVCGGMERGVVGDTGQIVLHDGWSGTLATVGDDAWNPRATGLPWSESLCAPIDLDLQAYYVVHPASGELYLYDETFERVLDTRDPVEVYLREIHMAFRAYEPVTPLQRAVAATPGYGHWLEGRDA